MVAERQHIQSCDEDSPAVTSASKKARSTTPLNLYRPPALRKRIEELEVSSRNSVPDEPEAPKVERVRPAKQRRPDIQVYVPRAKRILATPDDRSKGATASLPVQPENRKTCVSKKNDKRESQSTRTKTKSSESVSSGRQSKGVGSDKNDLRQVSDGKSVCKERRHSVEAPYTSTECVRECEPAQSSEEKSLLTFNKDFGVPAEPTTRKEVNEPQDENCGRCSPSLDYNNTSEIDFDVQVENSDCSMHDEYRADLNSSFCAECESETPQEDSNNSCREELCCKTCCKVSRLCHCNIVDLQGSLNESSELSTCSADFVLSENISDVGKVEITGVACLDANNTSSCNFGQGSGEIHSVPDECDIEIETNKSSECNSVLQKMSLEESEETTKCVGELSSKATEHAQHEHLLKENESCADDLKRSESENLSQKNVPTNINTNDGTVASDMVLDRRKSEVDNEDKVISNSKEKLTDTVVASSDKAVQKSTAPIRLNRDECTWEMMFDDNGDCLDPRLIEEITSAVGSVKIEKPKSDYNSYQNKPEIYLDPGDEFSHVIEIYNFPAAFKTEDLVTIFSPYRNGGFEIKWVDNTHALGVFSSAFVAAEVLAADHPFVKTRPLREASHESRMKARRSAEFLQPYKERPETCAALARRLVTGALGVKLNTSREEREAERRVLREAREKKRLAAKQREEIWEGTFSAN